MSSRRTLSRAGGTGFTGQGAVYMTGAPGGAGGYVSTLLSFGAGQTLTVQVASSGGTATSGGREDAARVRACSCVFAEALSGAR